MCITVYKNPLCLLGHKLQICASMVRMTVNSQEDRRSFLAVVDLCVMQLIRLRPLSSNSKSQRSFKLLFSNEGKTFEHLHSKEWPLNKSPR